MGRSKKGALCLLFLALIASFVFARAGSGAEPAQKRTGGRKNAQLLLAKGREIYIANCARCHGSDGLGKTKIGELFETPDITSAKWQARRSDRRMQQAVARGRGQMPAFGERLSKTEIAAVVAYVRSLKK